MKLPVLICLLLLGATHVALAQQADSTRQYEALDAVVITGQHGSSTTSQSVYQVRVLDKSRIEAQAAQSLTDLLQSELGVQLFQDPALGTQIQLQGLSGQNVKVLIDGVPVIGRLGGEIDLSQLPLSQIERIEVVEGPMSVEYGTNALGGVVNLITKQNSQHPWEARLGAYEANVGPGWSVYEGLHNQDAEFRVRQGRHQYGLSAGRYFFGGSFAERQQRASSWNPKRQAFGGGDYRYQGQKGWLRLQSQYFDEYLLQLAPPEGIYQIRARDEHYNSRRQQHQLQFDRAFAHGLQWQGTLAYSQFRRLRDVYLVDLVSLETERLIQEQRIEGFTGWTARGTIRRSFRSGRLSASVGYDLNRESTTGDKILNERQSVNDLAAFASAEYKPRPHWTIRPGLRAAWNDRYPAPLTPSLHLRYAPSFAWQWRASYARGFRAPTLKELYLDFVDVNHNLIGNENLKAEYGHYVQFSGQWQKIIGEQLWRISGQTFYNQVEDRIELVLVGGGDNVYTYFNVSDVRLSGGRLELSYRRERWNVQFGTNLLGRSSADLPWTFSSQWNARLQLTLPGALQLNLFYKYNSPVQTFRNQGDAEQPELVLTSLAAYHWADMSLQRSFWEERLQLSTGAKNLFHVTSVAASGNAGGAHSGGEGQTAIALGRSFFLGLNVRLYAKRSK